MSTSNKKFRGCGVFVFILFFHCFYTKIENFLFFFFFPTFQQSIPVPQLSSVLLLKSSDLYLRSAWIDGAFKELKFFLKSDTFYLEVGKII